MCQFLLIYFKPKIHKPNNPGRPITICCTRLLTPPNSNSIIFSQFFRLRRLCSDELDYSSKSEEILQFFKYRGYPDSLVKAAQQRAQTADQQSAPQTSQKKENQRIPFTHTFHPLKLSVKNIILKNFKLLQNDNETSRIFSLPSLIL